MSQKWKLINNSRNGTNGNATFEGRLQVTKSALEIIGAGNLYEIRSALQEVFIFSGEDSIYPIQEFKNEKGDHLCFIDGISASISNEYIGRLGFKNRESWIHTLATKKEAAYFIEEVRQAHGDRITDQIYYTHKEKPKSSRSS